MKNLNGKTAIVTGASRGIGVHIVESLTQCGVNVIGIARSKSGLEATGKLVEQNSGNFDFFEFDLANSNGISDLECRN